MRSDSVLFPQEFGAWGKAEFTRFRPNSHSWMVLIKLGFPAAAVLIAFCTLIDLYSCKEFAEPVPPTLLSGPDAHPMMYKIVEGKPLDVHVFLPHPTPFISVIFPHRLFIPTKD